MFRYTACSEPGDEGAPVFSSEGKVGTVLFTGSCAFGGATHGVPTS